MQIKKENVLKAHEDGCDDTKKVLENLFPELFEKKITLIDYIHNYGNFMHGKFRGSIEGVHILIPLPEINNQWGLAAFNWIGLFIKKHPDCFIEFHKEKRDKAIRCLYINCKNLDVSFE